jgi:SAM-dependent methyltransferase
VWQLSSMPDPVAFSSGQLPTEHFNTRFAPESVAFWVPLLIEHAQIAAGSRVLDVGCGTGGFARAIAEIASATVTGIDYSERFIAFARNEPPPARGAVEWKVGNAEALPVADGSFDRVLLSLVLHQLRHPDRAVAESFRALAAGGRVVVRTVAPENVARRVPHRFFPTMAATDAERMPPLDTIETFLRNAGFIAIDRRQVLRNSKVNLAHEERQMLVEARGRYSFIPASEIDAGMNLMRAEAKLKEGNWLDPRPAHFVAASKPMD